jgi:hypothetical protein
MPVGRDQSGAPATGQEPQVRAGRRASDAKMAGPVVWLRHLDWLDYADLGFFFVLAAGFGAAFCCLRLVLGGELLSSGTMTICTWYLPA